MRDLDSVNEWIIEHDLRHDRDDETTERMQEELKTLSRFSINLKDSYDEIYVAMMSNNQQIGNLFIGANKTTRNWGVAIMITLVILIFTVAVK